MKTLKRIVSVALAFLMLFSSISILSSAELNDGNGNSFVLTTKFYRYDATERDWIETTKAAKGEEIRVRIFMESDFYAGTHKLFWLFPSDFMTFNGDLYSQDRTNPTLYTSPRRGDAFENVYDEDSIPYIYEWAVDVITALAPGASSPTDAAKQTITNGYLTEADYEDMGWLTITNAEMAEAVMLTPDYYLYEISFTVNDDAEGVGTFKTPETVILTPERKNGVFYIDRHKSADDILNPENMRQFQADWTLDQDAFVSTQSTFTFNVDGKSTSFGADIGSVYGDTNAVADPAGGKVFLGWDDASTEAEENYTSAEVEEMEVGYDDMTFNAVFEPAEADYFVKAVKQNEDGTWPSDDEIAAIEATRVDSKLGTVISAKDYAPVPAGFVISNPDDKVTVDATDTDVLIVKLARQEVTVTFDGGNSVTGLYGSTQKAPVKTTGAGYSNEGWYTTDAEGNLVEKVAADGGEFKMPAATTNYTSNITADAQDLTVNVTYYDTIAKENKTVPVTFEDATVTGGAVEIVAAVPTEPVEGVTYILLSDIAAKANLEHYAYAADSGANNLKGTASATGLTLTVGYEAVEYKATFDTTVDGVADVVLDVAYGSTVAADDLPTKEAMEAAKPGYTFEGWFSGEDEFVPGETVVTGEVTYSAKFTAKEIKITYAYAGDDIPADEESALPKTEDTAIYDETFTLPDVKVPDGYKLEWTVEGATKVDATTYKVGTTDVEVTGTWSLETYTLTYYYWDDRTEADVMDEMTLTIKDEIPALVAEMPGYQFVEWIYYDAATEEELEAEPETMPAKDIYAVATLSPIKYTIQFIKYDIIDEYDFVEIDTVVDYYQGMVLDSQVPATGLPENYRFLGWKDADGNEVEFTYIFDFTDDEGNYVIIPEDSTWTYDDVTANATLEVYADYLIPVEFDPDGGYFTVDGETVEDSMIVYTRYDEFIAKDENNWNIAKDGYTFDSWDTVFENGDEILPEEVAVEGQVYFVALWLPNINYVFDGTVPAGITAPATVEGAEYDTIIEVPEFVVPGYSYTVSYSEDAFDNGDGTYSIGDAPVTVTYNWTADGDIDYTVETYLENAGVTAEEFDADNYTFKENVIRTGATGDDIDFAEELYTGFKFEKLEPADATIGGDGKTVVKAYYSRNTVKVTVTDEDGNEILDDNDQPIVPPTAETDDKIEEPTYKPDTEEPGKEFDKWVDEDGKDVEWPLTVKGDEDIVIIPTFKDTDYKVTYVTDATGEAAPAGFELPNAAFANTEVAHYGDPVEVPDWNNDTVPGYNVTITVTGAAEDGTVGEDDVVVTAKWSKDIFTVTYVTVGEAPAGYELPADVENATIGTKVEVPNWTAPAGYKLDLKVEGAERKDDGSYEVYNDNVTITATWTYEYYTVDYVTVGEAPAGYELPADVENAVIDTPIDVPDWNDDTVPGYNVTITVEGAAGEAGAYKVGTSDVTVTATWTYDNYTVDYVTVGKAPAGYELPADVENAIIGTPIAIPAWATEAAPAGYTMKLEVVNAVEADGAYSVGASDVTVTVTWEYVPYTVTYSFDETAPANAVVPAQKNIHVNEIFDLETPAAVDGYSFAGWTVTGATENEDGTYTALAGNVTAVGSWTANEGVVYFVRRHFEVLGQDGVYGAEENLIRMTGTAGQPATYAEEVLGFNLDHILPADATIGGDGKTVIDVYYTRKSVQVTFLNEDGTTNSELSGAVEFGGTIAKPADPVSADAGKAFDEWVYEDGTPVTWNITVNAEAPIVIKPTFYNRTYLVRFFISDDKIHSDIPEAEYTSKIAIPEDDPKMTGYTFIEWRRGSADGPAWTANDTVPVGGVDYYAHFQPNGNIAYKITKNYQNVTLDGFDYSLTDTKEYFDATAGEKMTLDLEALAEEGFTIDKDSSTYELVINGNGQNEFEINYLRNKVTIVVDGVEEEAIFGDKLTEEEAEAIIKENGTYDEGYEYTGWEDETDKPVTFPYTVPAAGGKLTPVYNLKSFTLTFVDDNGETVQTGSVEYKSVLADEAPDYPGKEGYTPTGWYDVTDGTAMPETMPAKNVTYKVGYTNATNTAYTITIYIMDLEGEYSIKTSTTAYGTTGDTARIEPAELKGLYEDTTHADRNLSAVIEANGSTELRIFYARQKFTVTYDDGAPIEAYYGSAVPAPAADPVAPAEGKEFAGWFDKDGNKPADYASMPDSNLEFTSSWTDASYTITYVVNGTQTTETYKYGEAIKAQPDPEVPGMTFTGWVDEDGNKGIPATMPAEDIILVAQFGTAYYTVTFLNDVDGEVFEEITVLYGAAITLPATQPSKEYHTFIKWSNVPETMPAENIVIVPEFERVPVKLVRMDGSTTEIDYVENIITGLKTNLSDSVLRSQFLKVEGDGYIVINTYNDQYGFYGTGATVDLYDNVTGKLLETYTIVVFGDINGDSRINSTDSSMVSTEANRSDLNNLWSYEALATYDKYKTMAADIDMNGKVNATDVGTITNATLGSVRIDQVTREVIRADA